MKKVLITVLLCMAAIASAQRTVPTADGYTERFAKVSRAYAKEPDNVEALYNMAMFYYDNSHPMRSLPMAMRYIQLAEAQQIALLEQDRYSDLARLAKKDITLPSIRQMKQSIVEAAYNTLGTRSDMSCDELDAYIEAFDSDPELVRQLRQRYITRVYYDDLLAGTAQSYYHFIDLYPGTNEAEQMEGRLAEMASGLFNGAVTEAATDSIAARYPLSPSVARAAVKHKSRLAYNDALHTNTIAAYNDFLNRYPSSDDDQPAREKLGHLLEVQYATLTTARQYADFVQANADNPLADSAMAEIRRIIVENHDVEAARLYLDRFRQDEYRGQVFNTYYAWHAEEGNGALVKRFDRDYPDYPYQRAVEADLERADMIDRIYLLDNCLDADFERYAGYVRMMTGKRIALVALQRLLQPKLATGSYQAALGVTAQFDICFEGIGNAEYNEINDILRAPSTGRRPTAELSAQHNILNPSLSAADGRLYFTLGDIRGRSRIAYAERQAGAWRIAGSVLFDNIDPEGLTLYSLFDGGKGMLLGKDGDIWIAELADGQWRISDIPAYPVNTDYREADAYMLPDGSGMLLASDRPGGENLNLSGEYFHGDTAMASDLYFIPRTPSGWGTPQNLGPKVNSPYSERCPVISRNLQTLYFVTDSRGLGFGDIYMATRTDVEDWTSWSAPVNIGKEVNSPYNECGLSFSPDEKRLYYSAGGPTGLYAARSVATAHATGDNYRNLGVDILGPIYRIRVANLSTQSVIQQAECQADGQPVGVNVHQNNHYAILGDAGESFVPAIIVGPGSRAPRLRAYTLPVLVALDKPVPLPVVGFDGQSARLTPLARLQIEQLAQFARRNPTATIEIVVNVALRDDVRSYALSLERGRAVRELLCDLGVDADRISVSAYGNVNTKQGEVAGVAVHFRE